MDAEAHKLHMFFFPLMAYGHMIPMVDIARLVAARGVKVTIVTTFLNADLLVKVIGREQVSGLDIGIKTLRFPAKEAGLPEGNETVDFLNTPEMVGKFYVGMNLLQEPLRQLLEEQRPDAIVADLFLSWVTDIACSLGIPRIVFHGISFFSLCMSETMTLNEPYNKIPAEQESFVVPGLPDQIEITRSQLPDHLTDPSSPSVELMVRVREAELRSYGVIVNSFYELEPAYAEHYKNVLGRKAWHVGPASLRNKDTADKAQRGRKSSVDEHYVLNWLELQNSRSVLYICFGSMSRLGTSQMMAIAMGLESSGVSFVWVIRTTKTAQVVEENFLPEGFEERIKGKGLIIRGWAPQVLILDHQAIGGFMTHCGWNSTLEGITAGVPMITWPMFAEQFYNEKLITQVLKTGIEVGIEKWSLWIDAPDVFVKKERVQEMVVQLMGDGEEVQRMRRRASEFKDMARRAVEKDGSSYKDVTAMIEELRIYKRNSSRNQI